MSQATASPTQLAWRKYRQHLPAMLGTVYVGFCLLLSLLGYLVAPDGSTHANFQVLELAKSSPGCRS